MSTIRSQGASHLSNTPPSPSLLLLLLPPPPTTPCQQLVAKEFKESYAKAKRARRERKRRARIQQQQQVIQQQQQQQPPTTNPTQLQPGPTQPLAINLGYQQLAPAPCVQQDLEGLLTHPHTWTSSLALQTYNALRAQLDTGVAAKEVKRWGLQVVQFL